MHTVHLLCLTALTFCKLITSHPIQQNTDLTGENQNDMEAKISSDEYFQITKLSHRMMNGIYEESSVILLKKRSKDCISLVDNKNNHIMCLESTKKPSISVNAIKDCFKTIQGKNLHRFCSWRKEKLKPPVYDKESPPSPQSDKHKTLRPKRNQHFDPSDPLGSESRRSRTTNYRRPNREHEHERSSNVSKETISSCDDPLHVLLSKSPTSPNLQKEKKNKQVAPSDPF